MPLILTYGFLYDKVTLTYVLQCMCPTKTPLSCLHNTWCVSNQNTYSMHGMRCAPYLKEENIQLASGKSLLVEIEPKR